jgi:hypothetical protein
MTPFGDRYCCRRDVVRGDRRGMELGGSTIGAEPFAGGVLGTAGGALPREGKSAIPAEFLPARQIGAASRAIRKG